MGFSNTHLLNSSFHCVKGDQNNYLCFQYSSFCYVLSLCVCITFFNIKPPLLVFNGRCVFEQLRMLRLKNPKKVTLGHLNINSIPNKFEGIMDLVKENLDIFLISETKIDISFPDAQFCCYGYSTPHRRDRKLGGGGGLLMYVNENIPSRLLKEHDTPDDLEIICVEINLRKQKWVIMGIYRPPSMNKTYFFDHLNRITDYYSSKYDRVIILGDFNTEPSEEHIETFCNSACIT